MAIAIPAVIAVVAVSLIDHRRSASAQAESAMAPVGASVKEA
jgi:AAHS family benzoate transporter-like MFS transporter